MKGSRGDRGDKSPEPMVIESITQRLSRASATIERLEPPQPDDWITGEHYFGAYEDTTGPRQALRGVASTELAVQPVVRARPTRAAGHIESMLRLAALTGALLCVGVFFFDALYSSVTRLVTRQRWRSVPVTITSAPRARVFIGEQDVGWTPVSRVEYCRGRGIRVRVEAPGHDVWTWDGLCPNHGELKLDAQPNPRVGP